MPKLIEKSESSLCASNDKFFESPLGGKHAEHQKASRPHSRHKILLSNSSRNNSVVTGNEPPSISSSIAHLNSELHSSVSNSMNETVYDWDANLGQEDLLGGALQQLPYSGRANRNKSARETTNPSNKKSLRKKSEERPAAAPDSLFTLTAAQQVINKHK